MGSPRTAPGGSAAALLLFGCALLYFNWPLAGAYLERGPLTGFVALFLGWLVLIGAIALRAAGDRAERAGGSDRRDA